MRVDCAARPSALRLARAAARRCRPRAAGRRRRPRARAPLAGAEGAPAHATARGFTRRPRSYAPCRAAAWPSAGPTRGASPARWWRASAARPSSRPGASASAPARRPSGSSARRAALGEARTGSRGTRRRASRADPERTLERGYAMALGADGEPLDERRGREGHRGIRRAGDGRHRAGPRADEETMTDEIRITERPKSYEAAVERLETIIARLDSNEAGLSETLDALQGGPRPHRVRGRASSRRSGRASRSWSLDDADRARLEQQPACRALYARCRSRSAGDLRCTTRWTFGAVPSGPTPTLRLTAHAQ